MSAKIKVLIIGGTGIISSDVTILAAQRPDIDLYVLNRGLRPSFLPPNIKTIQVDIYDDAAVRAKLEGMTFDVICDFISSALEALEPKLALFNGCFQQYVYVSSVAAYRPGGHTVITEENTRIGNPFWDYGRNKTLCEKRVAEFCEASHADYTIVRPAYTCNHIRLFNPYTISHWESWTFFDRLLRGKPYVLPDDGQYLCTVTHTIDFAKAFVGLWGNPAALNKDFHITSSEYLTWKRVVEIEAEVLGVKPVFCFVPAEQLYFDWGAVAGQKIMCETFHQCYDSSKVRKAVPDFVCTVPFAEGVRRALEFYRANPEFQKINAEWNKNFDRASARFGQ